MFCQEAFFYIHATFINGARFHRGFILRVLGCTLSYSIMSLDPPGGRWTRPLSTNGCCQRCIFSQEECFFLPRNISLHIRSIH